MVKIDEALCIGCGLCVDDCFPKYLAVSDKKAKIVGERCIACGHCVAICPQRAVSIPEYGMAQVKAYNEQDFTMDSQNLITFMQFRRTIRQYEDRAIEEEKLAQIFEAGRYSPTGGNRQGVSYILVQKQLPALRDVAIDSLYQASSAPTNSFKAYSAIWKQMYEMNQQGHDMLFYDAPALLLVVDDAQASDVDGALAASRMELMANALGLGCCFNGFFLYALKNEPKLGAMLGLEDGQKVVITMTIGYPKVHFARTAPRKEAQVRYM